MRDLIDSVIASSVKSSARIAESSRHKPEVVNKATDVVSGESEEQIPAPRILIPLGYVKSSRCVYFCEQMLVI